MFSFHVSIDRSQLKIAWTTEGEVSIAAAAARERLTGDQRSKAVGKPVLGLRAHLLICICVRLRACVCVFVYV